MNKFSPVGKVKVANGTVLAPESGGLSLVLSTANLAGKPESPLMPLFDKKWKQLRADIKGWYATRTGAYKYGAINTTAVQSDVWVVHCLCQDTDLKTDLTGLEECLKKTLAIAKSEKGSIHIGGALLEAIPELQELVMKHFVNNGVNVYFYKQ